MPNFNLRNISEGDKLVEFKTQNGWIDYNREGSIGNIVISSDGMNLSVCLKEPVGPSISCVDATNIASIETANDILEVNGVIIYGVSYPYRGQLADINETHDLSDLIEVKAEFEPKYVTHIRSKYLGSNITIALSPSVKTPIVGMENNPTIGIDGGLLTLCLSERQYYNIKYPNSSYIDKPSIISVSGLNNDITDINELRLVTSGGDITVGPPELSNGQISWSLTANTGEELTVTIVDVTGLPVGRPYTYVPKRATNSIGY